jgi:hypothetical protein
LLRTQRCPPADVDQTFYLLFSLGAYFIAYLFLTVFLTSYDRTPIEGEISFKSKGVAFFDNLGEFKDREYFFYLHILDLLLVIDFLLLPEQSTRVRGILSILILLTLVCYNIRTQPCYVRPVNYWRTASLCCILWTALVVPIVNDESLDVNMSKGGIIGLIIGGWIVISLFFVFVRYCYRSEPYDPEEEMQMKMESTAPARYSNISVAEAVSNRLKSATHSAQSLASNQHGHHSQEHYQRVMMENGRALERAISRARPPPWKDPWAPLPPYYRQYQASSARRREIHRARLNIPDQQANLHRSNTTFNQQDRQWQSTSSAQPTHAPPVMPSATTQPVPPMDSYGQPIHPGYQPRYSLPDIPTFIMEQLPNVEEPMQMPTPEIPNMLFQPIPPPPLSIPSGPSPWMPTEWSSSNMAPMPMPAPMPASSSTPAMPNPSAPSDASTLRSTLSRARTRSLPTPPTWLGDIRELSHVSERTEPSDTSPPFPSIKQVHSL